MIKSSGINRIMITRMDQGLFAYTRDQWVKLEDKILHLPEKSEAMRRFIRFFIGGAHECTCDSQGRVLIPPTLKQYAGLEKEIVLVGVLDRFEIWSRKAWDQENEMMEKDLTDDQVRHEIAQLGI